MPPLRTFAVRAFDRTAPGPRLSMAAEEPGYFPETALYRFFDARKRLLYVGVSGQLRERWPKHRRKAPWWSEADFVSVEHWSTEVDALAAERAAIAAEQPLFNKRSARRQTESTSISS
ncbi:hypothetical protein ACFYUY_01790 [Kitasatospora sp. NPDC004745]|uniref:hypothetical protein n=1 Tax=Kitasatospora sp. NPDC004745 TaxID=3364019 RepID=UPI003696A683